MPITLSCDKCAKPFEVDDEHAGSRAACPFCGDVNRVPSTDQIEKDRRELSRQGVGAGATAKDEEVIAVVRQAMFRAHPLLYSALVLLIVGGCIAAGLAAASVVAVALVPVGFGVAAVGALALLGWWLAPHRWTKLVITSRRTIRQEGIVMRKTSEVLHQHVTNVVIEQSLLQRLLDVGYIGLDTAGQGGMSDSSGRRNSIEIQVSNIPKPYEVKALIDRYRIGDGKL